MDEGDVVGPGLEAHLTRGFQEGQGLDVAHGAADLDDGHVGVSDAWRRRADEFLDLVGDVGITCTVLLR